MSRTTLAHAVAGSVGSQVAMTLTFPLDRLRTLKQLKGGEYANASALETLQLMLRDEGFFGLYRGLSHMLLCLGTSNFVYFYCFTALRTVLQYTLRRGKPKGNFADPSGAASNLILASLAGCINVLLTTPLWVAYTRLAVQTLPRSRESDGKDDVEDSVSSTQYSGLLDAMIKISLADGVGALWSGLGPSLILVSNPSIQTASYETLKNALLRFRFNEQARTRDLSHFGDVMDGQTDDVNSEAVFGSGLSSAEYLVLGAVAKMIATVITYPLQVAQTRLRAARQKNPEKEGSVSPPTTFSCLRDIFNEEGVAGLYHGMEAKLLQTCLTSAFMFAAYEKIVSMILRFLLWRKIAATQ